MPLCNSSVFRYIANENFEYLNSLSPVKRASEIFRLEVEEISGKLNENDELFTMYTFDKASPEKVSVFDEETPSEEGAKLIDLTLLLGGKTSVDNGHTLADYDYILRNGLVSYEERIDAELLSDSANEYLLAMKDVLKTAGTFVEKLIAEADKNSCCNAEKIKETLKRVPYYPARNFREALQAVCIVHFLIPLAANTWASISLGKFDEYMYPYYEKSVEEGMTREEAKEILHDFYKYLNMYTDGACMLNVGCDGYNEFSELLIECQRDFALPGPILGAIISTNTPEKIWDMLIDQKLFAMGQPTFYSKNGCREALIEKGILENIAKTFSNNSCMGISIAGEEFASMWGCVVSISPMLEAALNCGKVVHRDFTVPGISPVENIEELYVAFEKTAEYIFDIYTKAYFEKVKLLEKNNPHVFLSVLTKGCIENHGDRISNAVYHNVTTECIGMINVSDGICAVDKLVFKDKKYTIEQITEALRNNFAGFEKIEHDIKCCSKYGQNGEADLYAVRVAEILQKVIRSKNYGNVSFCPSMHTLDTNIYFGSIWGAGYDGRKAKTPFAKNAGPSNDVRKKDPTSMVLSAAKLPQTKFFGGQPIDINFSANTIKNHKREIKALIDVYMQTGGLQLQVNCMSSAVLKDAVENPQNYTDLVVRLGGYSAYFNDFSPATKQEFIERAGKEES